MNITLVVACLKLKQFTQLSGHSNSTIFFYSVQIIIPNKSNTLTPVQHVNNYQKNNYIPKHAHINMNTKKNNQKKIIDRNNNKKKNSEDNLQK